MSTHSQDPHMDAVTTPAPPAQAMPVGPVPTPAPPLNAVRLLGATLPWMALSACGGGGGGTTSSPAPVPVAPAPAPAPSAAITQAQAARFLGQAAFGATDAQMLRVQTLGYAGWIDEQAALPRTQGHVDWMVEKGYAVAANVDNFNGVDNTLWRKLIGSPDALRQRVALALSEIFVVSMSGLPVSWRGLMAAGYMDLLEENAFGTYRQLLEAVTLSNAMGAYLNMRGNQKADPVTGRQPDENYAREVLQLFSIGLVELEQDGTPKGGQVRETYGQDTIANLARVFTGWEFDGTSRTDPAWARRPMVHLAARHDTGAKSLLGVTIAAGTLGPQALRQALDAIAAHPNVAPFISRQLIQRLVCSHPSAGYVGRVAAVFQNNGAGVRGDLKAVVKAILLDTEARQGPASGAEVAGRLIEPVVRFVQWARSFGLASPTGLWNIGSTADSATRLGQSPLRAPSVFNFFRPGYVPGNSALGARGITAPEFQITDEVTVTAWVNFAQTFVVSGVGETRPDYSAELALATDAPALVRRVALLLTGSTLAPATVDAIATAVGSLSATTEAARLTRVHAAVLLVLAAPEYLVQV